MDLFKLYDPSTWLRPHEGFPCIRISDEMDTVFSGRDPREYFKYFDIKKYGECEVIVWLSQGSYVNLGTIAELNYKLPYITYEFHME